MRLLVLLFSSILAPSFGAVFDHSLWDRVLKTYVNPLGEVDYAALQQNRKDLDSYVNALAESSPENRPDQFPTTAHELAYWLNAYNAFVMRGVVDRYPIKSVRDVGLLRGFFWGFFRPKAYTAGGAKMSLNTIENDILRKRFRDARIHFAIVYASVSSPRLSRNAFTAETLHDELDRLARQFIRERRSAFVERNGKLVRLSSIFEWYREDFEHPMGPEGPKQDLLAYVRRYLSDSDRRLVERVTDPEIEFNDHDWALNSTGSRAKSESPLEREVTSGRSKEPQ